MEEDIKTNETFKGHYEMIDGKPVLVIDVKAEERIHPDGRKDVVITLPTLDTIKSNVIKIGGS